LQTILVGYDGTEVSIRSLEFATQLLFDGSKHNQPPEFHLAYVLEKPRGISDPIPDEVMASLRRTGEEILSNGARVIRKQFAKPIMHLEFGSPPEKLLEIADLLHPDLIVIGIRSHTTSEKILGSVSALLFKTRKYRVLCVP
jgi:nucleotide-binding universal stress UspA family protein